MGNKVTVEWSEKDKEQCVVYEGLDELENPSASWQEQALLMDLARTRVPMEHAQVVAQLKQQKGVAESLTSSASSGTGVAANSSALAMEGADLSTLRKRVWRVMVVTPGALIMGPASRSGAKRLLKASKSRWIVALTDIRKVAMVDEGNQLVWLVPMEGFEPPILYQTPYFQGLPWLQAWSLAYVGVPPWAVPCHFQGFNLSKITMPSDLQLDGGFSYRWQARLWSRLVAINILRNYKKPIASLDIRGIILTQLQKLQPEEDPLRHTHFQRVNVSQLVIAVMKEINCEQVPEKLWYVLEQDVLDCLTFNLIVRDVTFRVKDDNILPPARLLLYNVTLRSLNLNGSDLSHNQYLLGNALAENAQPILNKIILDNCSLTDEGILQWLPGLVRMWGSGGSSYPLHFSVANNSKVSAATWDRLFQSLTERRGEAPAPVMQFWQYLNVTGTNQSVGLANLLKHLVGLRHFIWDHNGSDRGQILQALADSGAPLEYIYGRFLNKVDHAVFPHAKTLRKLELKKWAGDAGSIVNGWPEPVPKLTLVLEANQQKKASCSTHWTGHCPGEMRLMDQSTSIMVLKALSLNAAGLQTLELHHIPYTLLVSSGALSALALDGFLKKLVFLNPPNPPKGMSDLKNVFWETLATSKSIEYLDVSGQFTQPQEITMVGQFLRKNRSVRHLFFDSPHVRLDPEDVANLRSAFYGNKKVIEMPYFKQAHLNTVNQISHDTRVCNQKIMNAKATIKQIFKSHYSKYNHRWRDKPNRLKRPYVETIRQEKRKIGRMNRGAIKIGRLMEAVKYCLQVNEAWYKEQQQEKALIRLEKRKPQLQRLAEKKRKAMTTLLTKFHKARQKAVKKRTAKEQVPRAAYYRHRGNWPHYKMGRRPGSHYHRYNDPFYRRYYYGCPSYPGMEDNSMHGSNNDDGTPPALPPYVLDGVIPDSSDDDCTSILPPVSHYCNPSNMSAIDSLERGISDGVTDSGFMSEMHQLFGEHGPDTLSSLTGVMDSLSKVNESVNQISDGVGSDPQEVAAFMTSVESNHFSAEETLAALPEIEDGDFDLDDPDSEFNQESVEVDEDVETDEADEAVDMYAGAGPANLPKGGPPPEKADPVKAGAMRRAITRSMNRYQKRARGNPPPCEGYQTLSLVTERSKCENIALDVPRDDWPGCIASLWRNEVTSAQIKSISDSDFVLPTASEFEPENISSWPTNKNTLPKDIEVCLVTQCSYDRLSNLENQLKAWNGKSSVALFVKQAEALEARDRIKSLTFRLQGEIAVTLVEAASEKDAYPINYLRNVALLRARNEFRDAGVELEQTAVFLVDVDFVPSLNLHKELHTLDAAREILDRNQVVVIPAFEFDSQGQRAPQDCYQLKRRVDEGRAEPFHVSHFAQGHGPTRFDHYWALTDERACVENPWEKCYAVSYEKLFEPYVVMKTSEVPLYDERFAGYGLNKVSHLASVANLKRPDLLVLPQVFVCAPYHERSDSYTAIYGSSANCENDYAKLSLKALYHNFIEHGYSPVVSDRTKELQKNLFASTIHKTSAKRVDQAISFHISSPCQLTTNYKGIHSK